MDNEKERIKNVMSLVFELPIKDISKNSSHETIETWDSLKHMNLVIALEEEFKIEFSDDEILEMMDYSSIETIIINK